MNSTAMTTTLRDRLQRIRTRLEVLDKRFTIIDREIFIGDTIDAKEEDRLMKEGKAVWDEMGYLRREEGSVEDEMEEEYENALKAGPWC